ncbi:MAG: hypothetical protein WD767_09035 [Alphaproteobacteria bacterium]
MASEFLVLTDRGGRLSAVSDDAAATVGRSGGEIRAGSLFSLFTEESGGAVRAALRIASPRSATAVTGLKILTGSDNEALFDISIEPAGSDRFWVRFTPVAPAETGPLARENFLEAVSSRLGLPGGDDMRLFMIDFDGLRDARLSRRLGEDAARNVRAGIEAALGAAGGPVGRLAVSSYGVLAAADQDQAEMVASAVEAAERLGVSAQDLGAQAQSVVLDAVAADPGKRRGLLSHLCHKFSQTVRHGADFGSDRLSGVSEEITRAVRLIETALDRDDVAIYCREVRMLATGEVKLVLAHGELVFGDESVLASRLLVLADHPELCCRHDRAVATLALAAQPDPRTTVIVDIHPPTLETGAAVAFAAEQAGQGRTVGFRPLGIDTGATRSRAMRQLYRLLQDGYPVWLVNFSAAIAKTRQLRGAYVEVSATFLRDVSAMPDRNVLLSRLLKAWNDVEVSLVAVNVDSKNLAAFVGKLGVAYGIGMAADPAADAPQSTRDMAARSDRARLESPPATRPTRDSDLPC